MVIREFLSNYNRLYSHGQIDSHCFSSALPTYLQSHGKNKTEDYWLKESYHFGWKLASIIELKMTEF